jgi:lipopolysaccharide transport system ATP-binding protein
MTIGSVTVTQVGKRFPRSRADRATTFKEAALRGIRGADVEHFWGLRDVSFTIAPGRMVGILGKNGAGKSTLLRLIGGVGRPDEGNVRAIGQIGALLDLSTDMADDLTGSENVLIAGVIAGKSRAEIRRRFDEIVAFSELEDFIDRPFRTYSSGMKMRLAFAVAVHADPDILLIDEVLAVGDFAFQRKCLDRIAEIKRAGCTILLVSHQSPPVKALCDEVLFLRSGRVVDYGPTMEVLAEYEASTAPEAYNSTAAIGIAPVPLPDGRCLRYGVNRFGTLDAEITSVRLLDPSGDPVAWIDSGDALTVELDYRTASVVRGIKAQVKVCLTDGTPVVDMTTEGVAVEIPSGPTSRTIRLRIERLDLAAGDYFVDVGLHEHQWQYSYDNHLQAHPLRVTGTASGRGLITPPLRWEAGSPLDEHARFATSRLAEGR